MDSGSSSLAIPAFVISIVGGSVAIAALAWNVLAWKWSGARVRVKLHGHQTDGIPREREFTAYIYNIGRHQVEVLYATLIWDGKRDLALAPLMYAGDSPSGAMLAPGAHLDWSTTIMDTSPIWKVSWYRVEVDLANGKVVKSKKMKVGPDAR